MATATLLKTPLYQWHAAHGGRLVEFGGWSMPVQYSTIVEEHQTVRNRVGLFDISHMGRLNIQGPDALDWLQRLTTNDVSRLNIGRIQYSLMCTEAGGVIDDVLVYRLENDQTYGLVCNASNRSSVLSQFEQTKGAFNAQLVDSTLETAMIAVQGPSALSTLQTLLDGLALVDLPYYAHGAGRILGTNVAVSRTGYTGEDGFELIIHRDIAEAAWMALLDEGRELGALACGLGARDTLRLEAGMPLYGHELGLSTNPYQVGLGSFVKLNKGDFIGRDALSAYKENPGGSRIGLSLLGKRIARQGVDVFHNDQRIGTVTSGTFSPTMQKPLAMALVQSSHLPVGTRLELEIRGHREPAEVVALPFYKRPRG